MDLALLHNSSLFESVAVAVSLCWHHVVDIAQIIGKDEWLCRQIRELTIGVTGDELTISNSFANMFAN